MEERTQITSKAESPSATPPQAARQVCRTITLTDEPQETDGFKGGPHQRIAKAIAGLIQPPEAKGIAIGIEGSWGSGKSTVGRILIKELEGKKEETSQKGDKKDEKKIVTVYFDAWAHEGDPLRRTFLETIIKDFQKAGWVDKQVWNECIEILANRRQEVTTEDKLLITFWGRVIVFTVLLVPIGGALIAAALREQVTFPGETIALKFLILLLLGILLSFSPAIVLLLGSIQEPDKDLLNLFLNKGPTKKATVTSKTANPTSIEFETNFEKLLKEALEGHDRRVVLILDNLDRVDAKDALSIWSTLQTFFQHKGTKRDEWHERLWLLVLYDYNGLKQLWTKDEAANGNTALSFIDKSFQVRFEVPALVLSDWRTFLADQLNHAFPDHSEPERHDVYRVLAVNVAEKSKTLTIRELKLFVNQIGAIHQQWAGTTPAEDPFPLSLIAYYVLLRRDNEPIVTLLRKPEFPSPNYRDLFIGDIRESIAAIAFNVEVGSVRQLLFSDRIMNALTLADPEELKKVASLLEKGFWEVFEQIAKNWAGGESSKVPDAAAALEDSGLSTNAYGPSLRSVMRAFSDSSASIKMWSPLTEKKARGLGVILKWEKELYGAKERYEEFSEEMFKAIALGFKEHSAADDQMAVTLDWLGCLNLIVKGLEAEPKQKAFETVANTVADEFNASLHSYQLERSLQLLVQLKKDPAITSIVEAKLRDLSDDGEIGRELVNDSEKSSMFIALMTYILMAYSSTFKGIPTRGSLSPEERQTRLSAMFSDATVQSLMALLEQNKQQSLLFKALNTSEDLKPLVVAALSIALNSSETRDLFVGPEAVERLEFVFREIDNNPDQHETLKRFFSTLPRELNLAENLTKKSFEPALANLYLLILETGNGSQAFTEWCIDGLKLVDSDTWQRHLFASNRLLNLASYLDQVAELVLGEQYFQGFVSALEKGIKGYWSEPPIEYQNLARLIGPLESKFRYAFQDQVRVLIRDSVKLRPWFFQLVGPELAEQLNSTRDMQVIEVFALILDREEEAGLRWLNHLLGNSGSSLEQKYSGTPAWANLQQAARRAKIANRFKVETHSLATSIADLLHVQFFSNGTIVFAASDDSRIIALPPGTSEELTLIEHPFQEYDSVGQPAWSPDGKRIAFIGSTAFKRAEIFVRTEATGEITQITSGSSSSRQPSWAPDGKRLAFTRLDGERSNIFTVDLETLKETQLTKFEKAEHPSWSPDGRRIVFQNRFGDKARTIGLMNADGSDVIHHHDGSDPSWSPGGDLIAFVMRSGDLKGLSIFNPNDDSPVKVIERDDVYNPAWSPDGTKLLYQVGTDSKAHIFQIDLDGQNKQELGKGVNPSWQPVLSDGPIDNSGSITASS